ncbi:MAG: aldehyde dehydrogenase family protein [Gammaproteobacteria bacterium]|nr:aldehyde dehydrogenase family protein [Gammaproteobacteria bacterium]
MYSIKVRNPRTGRIDYRFEQTETEELALVAASLRDAQKQWLEGGVKMRCRMLLELAAAISEQRGSLFDALTADTGRTRETELEINAVISSMERWCRLAPELLAAEENKNTSIPFIEIGRQAAPYPLAVVISPWNFPLLLSCIDAIPALLAGSAVVVKPSEITPRFVEPFSDILAAVTGLAPVFRFLQGDGSLGSALIDHADLVCFTGSVKTGRQVAEACARNFIPAQLELGGKDPAIVTADTDIERTAAALCWGGMVNAGQSCLSIERVYAEAPICHDLTAAIAQEARSLTMNTGNIDEGEIGPIISEAQRDIIETHLEDAAGKGAITECGGRITEHNGGLWCQPTVLSNVDHDMLVMTDETFGPILPVMAFDTDEEAIELANDTAYGLSAAVFANDAGRARHIAGKLEAGAISINDAALTSVMHEGEKQAFKSSGMGGSRMGPASIRRFLRSKALIENTQLCRDPWWY